MEQRNPDAPGAGLSAALAARYGEGPLPTVLPEAPIASMLAHRSVRAYLDRPLPEGMLETLVAAAQSASTSSHLHAWSVVAVQKPETKQALARLAGNQQHIVDAPLMLVWLADLSRLHDFGTAHDIETEGLDYLELFLVAAVDAALAAQNAAVAAEAQGLGIVYIGGMRNHPLEVAALLGLPPRAFAVFGMCVGYPDPARPAAVKPRLPQSAVLHREAYDPEAAGRAVPGFDALMTRFYEREKMPARNAWSANSARRVRGIESLAGRHVLSDVLRRLGFALK